jgi:hypothetical protein
MDHSAVGAGRRPPVPGAVQSAGAGVRARVKVLDPMTSIGPSMEAVLFSSSRSDLRIHVPRWIIPGSAVQVLTGDNVLFGTAWFSVKSGDGFEIEVEVQPTFPT